MSALLATGPASATAIYDAIVSSRLSVASVTNLTSPGTTGDLLIEGEATVFDSGILAIGDATADADGSATPAAATTLAVGDDVDLLAVAFGDAGAAAAAGTADSFFFTDGAVTLDNTSATDTYEVAFVFDYAAAATALVDDAVSEFAFALAVLSLLSTTEIDPIVDLLLEADTDLGLPGGLVVDSINFTVTVAPGGGESLLLLADAEGFAVNVGAVALPMPTALLGAGLLALGMSRRRSPAAPAG
ncbi:MAG: hypothetical protein QNJ91_02870 [Gammaproteobacteria bacterium]|nr:hypothetical protein [Gammaproteobacteria bacterium]